MKCFLSLFIFLITFNFSVAQEITQIISNILKATGGIENYSALNNLYKEGVIVESGLEDETIDSIKAKDVNYTNLKEYFVPFVGIKEEFIENKSNIKKVSIFNTTDAWICSQRIDATDRQFLDIKPVPNYLFNSIYYGTKKYVFYKDLVINNYSDPTNLLYDGFQIFDDKRYIKLIANNVNVIYVDAQTYLPYRLIEKVYDPKYKTEVITDYYFSEYKRINIGIVLPHKINKQVKGSTIEVVYKYSLIKGNALDDGQNFLSTKYINTLYQKRLENRKKAQPDSLSVPKNPQ